MSVAFDAGDVDLMVGAITRRPNIKTAIAAAKTSAHIAEIDADCVEDLDGNAPRAAYYRDYAKALRLAIRIAEWDSYTPPPPLTPGALPRLDAADVKARVDIVSYIDKHVHLVKAGHDRFVGVCPFHGDKSPSMSVWTDGRWRCFGCGVGGDVFEFVKLWHRCEFREALQILSGGT